MSVVKSFLMIQNIRVMRIMKILANNPMKKKYIFA